jgi:hypothetical protein
MAVPHRDSQIEYLRIYVERVISVNAGGAAGKDYAVRFAGLDFLDGGVVGDKLGIDAALSHAPRDQLAVLGSKIEYEDCFHMRAILYRKQESRGHLPRFAGFRHLNAFLSIFPRDIPK